MFFVPSLSIWRNDIQYSQAHSVFWFLINSADQERYLTMSVKNAIAQ